MTAASGILLKTGLVSLFAGFSLSLALSCAPKLLFSGEKVTIDLQGWNWMKQVQFGLNSPAAVREIRATPSRIEQLLAKVEAREKAAPPTTTTVALQAKVASAVPTKVVVASARKASKAVGKIVSAKKRSAIADLLETAAAAPIRESQDIAEEKAKLLGVFRMMRGKFHAALISKSDIQIVQVDNQAPAEPNTQEKPKIRISAKRTPKAPTRIVAQLRSAPIEAQAPPRVAKVPQTVVLHEIKPALEVQAAASSRESATGFSTSTRNSHKVSPSADILNTMSPAMSTQNLEPASVARPHTKPDDEAVKEVKEEPTPNESAPVVSAPYNNSAPTSAAKKPSDVIAADGMSTLQSVITQDNNTGANSADDYSMTIQAWGPIPFKPVAEIAAVGAPAPPAPKRNAHARRMGEDADEGLIDRTEGRVGPADLQIDLDSHEVLASTDMTEKMKDALQMNSSAPSRAVTERPAGFVEAYRWTETVTGVNTSWLSRDSEADRGWAIHRAEGFLPMLAWHSDDEAPTPLLSTNSGALLSKVADAKAHPALGMVFGKIPPGWTVELSGRAEHPVFIEETFALLNVEPGARILYMTRRSGSSGPGASDEASVGIPVLAGTVTFVDLVEPTLRQVSGRVLSADARSMKGIEGVQVSVTGQSRAAATDAKGRFVLNDVATIGTYPIFIDTDSTNGYRHRYTFQPSALETITLFQMSNEQVRDWVGQVEGGVSAQSGMIVAALPKLAAKHAAAGEDLVPGVAHLIDRAAEGPETYVLSPDGEMMTGKSLSSERSRFVSIEIPEGPAVAFVSDKTGRRWSELLVAQPGVINIIGPR